MSRAKTWEQVKKEWPDRPCVKASVFVPDGKGNGLEASMDGALPKGIAMLLIASVMSGREISPETDAQLLDMAKRMMLGQA